jgi:hypothetical protein
MSNEDIANYLFVDEEELREQVLTEFKQVHKLAPADYTENCTNVVMSIVQAHTNAEIARTLDSLEAEFDRHVCWYLDDLVEALKEHKEVK